MHRQALLAYLMLAFATFGDCKFKNFCFEDIAGSTTKAIKRSDLAADHLQVHHQRPPCLALVNQEYGRNFLAFGIA